MKIEYKTKRLMKELTQAKEMKRAYGQQAKKLMIRLAALDAAVNLADFAPGTPPERCHELAGNKKGLLSMDLNHPYRLLFEPLTDPTPLKEDGGLDWSRITGVRILAVEDTHGD